MVRMRLTSATLVLAFGLAPFAASLAAAQDGGAKTAAMENSCAATERKGRFGAVGGVFNKAKDKFKGSGIGETFGLKLTLGEGPMCLATTYEERVILTGMMIDRAALSAARGVDAVQVALGRKRTLVDRINELERALNGLGSGTTSATEVLITEVVAEGVALAAELDRLMKAKALDDKAREQLAVAQRNLGEVAYYSATAAAGGVLVQQMLSSQASTATLFAMLNSKRIGLGSDFAKALPDRAKKVPAIVSTSKQLREGIEKTDAPIEKAEVGETRARDQAVADAKRIQEALQQSGLPTTRVEKAPQQSSRAAH